MSKWDKYSTEELGDIYSDYSKDVNGFRDRTVNYTNREAVIAKLEELDRYMDSMKSTKEGREVLRADGWVIAEPAEPSYTPAYYDAEGGSMSNGLGRSYF